MFTDISKAYVPSFIGEVRQIVTDKIWQDSARDVAVTAIALVHAGASSLLFEEKFRLPPLTDLKAGANGLNGVLWVNVFEYQRCFEVSSWNYVENSSTSIFVYKSADLDAGIIGELQRLTRETEALYK